jgi:tetratricopeptide (TPR) repeat protein
MTRRLALAGTVAALAATVFLLGGALAPERSAAPATPAPSTDTLFPERSTLQLPVGDTPRAVRLLQTSLRRSPDDPTLLAQLGFTYEQRARETGDPAWYPKAEGVLERALALAPGDPNATSGLASLALSRHRFAHALALGRRALRQAPDAGVNLGIVGDALLELGRYREAFQTFDRMARVDPGLPSYARISYARELLGRPLAAIRPMQAAVDSSKFVPEPFAWSSVQLGKLYWSMGRLDAAALEYRRALALFPGYVYALDALAQVEAAHGHLRRAIELERRAVARTPLPQFVSALGDMYRAAGERVAAERQYALMGAIARLLRASGVKTDLELALFQVDHGIRPREALALARVAQHDRPSIDGDDVLGWALTRNGRCAEALLYTTRALRLGTRDALKEFHRGMVERCLGRRAAASVWFRRALTTNPHFSLLWSPLARRYAR